MNKKKNSFRFSGSERDFKIIRKISDMQNNPYIIKYKYLDNNGEFFLMYTDFQTQIKKGKIIFTPDEKSN